MITFDERMCQHFLSQLEQNHVEWHAMTIYQDGKRIFQHANHPYELNALHPLYSVTKSFTSLAFGYLMNEQPLDINQPWLNWFPEYRQAAHPSFQNVTLKHLLTMTLGQQKEVEICDGEDWILSIIKEPLRYEPGTKFFYNSMCSYLIGRLIEKQTGMTLSEYLRIHLFEPLHIERFYWESDKQGHNLGGFGLHMSTPDLAKVGQCLLNDENNILPKEWLAQAVTKQVENFTEYPDARSENRQGYGYYFWMCTHNAYRMSGLHGQLCFIQPQNKLVIAMSSATTGSQIILNSLFQAMDHPDQEFQPVRQAIEPVFGKKTSPLANQLFHKQWFAYPNSAMCESIRFNSQQDMITMTIHQQNQSCTLQAAYHQWLSQPDTLLTYAQFISAEAMDQSHLNPYNYPMFVSYAWKDDQTCIIQARALDQSWSQTWQFQLDKDNVHMKYAINGLYTAMPEFEILLHK